MIKTYPPHAGPAATGDFLLAIDDEPELLAIVERVAEGVGFKVACTTKPEEFKAVVCENEPSVVLLDLQMPDCDGVELLRFLSEQQCPAAVILVSGVDQRLLGIANGVGQSLRLNMKTPMHKPVRIAELRAILRGHLSSASEIDGPALQLALESEQISLHYQPLVDLRKGRLVGWEALARWRAGAILHWA
jgi:DNA-binding response OmpR family regulator